MRMARSASAAGWEATIYARLEPGLPDLEDHGDYRIVRVPADWRRAIPGLRSLARRRATTALAAASRLRGQRGPRTATVVPAAPGRVARVARFVPDRLRHWRRSLIWFPLRPLGWAIALDDVVEPADVWHGMWAGSLAAITRQRSRLGGHAVYDSRDIFMASRAWARLEWPLQPALAALERHWARRMDRVLTVNEPYADLLAARLGVVRPLVVMNCPASWTPPDPPPDRIREALGLPRTTAIALYAGQLVSDRGIEQAVQAVLGIPDTVLVLLGYGPMAVELARLAATPPYRGRVKLLPPVTPDELLEWTASADVAVMPIQPTSLNHRYTTPQKLFESLAAGVPVVASDLPGMRAVVEATGAGTVCDPTSPEAIAAALTQVLHAPLERRAALRAAALDAAHRTYNWEAQSRVLLELYRRLIADHRSDAAGAADSGARASAPASADGQDAEARPLEEAIPQREGKVQGKQPAEEGRR